MYQKDDPLLFYQFEDGDSVWCPTNQPVREKPDRWNSVHGLGYTRFEAEKDGLIAEEGKPDFLKKNQGSKWMGSKWKEM